MAKTLFEMRIDKLNRERGPKEPKYSFGFVGETSPESELDVQTKFILALTDINALNMFKS